jgi:membrane associated rhomboid family serine protease
MYALWYAGQQEQYGLVPFLVLYAAGFLVVGALTILHSTAHASRPGA